MTLANKKLIIVISSVAVLLFQNCGRLEVLVPAEDQSSLGFSTSKFQCDPQAAPPATLSLTLTKQQYINSISDVFSSNVVTQIDAELTSLTDNLNDSEYYQRTSLISSSEINTYHRIAHKIAATVVGSSALKRAVFGDCSINQTPEANCLDVYLTNKAERILRRPLTELEKLQARSLVDSAASFTDGLETLLAFHLQSPFFLWRLELGSAAESAAENATQKLTPFELATRISFITTDSAPDDLLFEAARTDQLQTQYQIRAHVERLLKSPRGQDKVANAFAWWSKANSGKDITILPAELTQGVQLTGLSAAMMDEAKQFVKHIVFTQQGTLKDLLTSQISFAQHAGLAQIYGHAPMAGLEPKKMAGRRQGLLMRAGFFTFDSPRTPLIQRGVDFQKRFLCNTVPSPNVDIADDRIAEVLDEHQLLMTSNREAIRFQTKAAQCMGCHSTINPTGNLFENMDSLGRLRQSEMVFTPQGQFVRSVALETSDNLFALEKSLALPDGHDLVNEIATSDAGSACATKNLHRYFYERLEGFADNCQLAKVHNTIQQNQPVLEALVELLANDLTARKVQ